MRVAAAALAALYLWQERRLKRRPPGILRLPLPAPAPPGTPTRRAAAGAPPGRCPGCWNGRHGALSPTARRWP